LMSFLYFGVYLEDPAFDDADYLNLNILLDNYKINSDKGCENHNDMRWQYE